MNRQQAEHLLDAYINLENGGGDNKARQSLREVILDAMTNYETVTYPSITWPSTQPLTVPNVIPNKTIVTCDAGGAQ